jgi:TonB family protein
MSYQALLFCPDERTARVVSQVLSELEFSVEPCHEPFAAVKKLMAQHFDALVVDCENEQNAALLFKSARNSSSNQASLAVAVVEGQAGVAKAFRLGANLVLTKPIHVEQSKGTLRVARGLLRKGQTVKPVGDPLPAVPRMPAPFSATPAGTPPPAASASAFELDAEPAPQPDPADAALLEYMPDSIPAGADSSQQLAADSRRSQQFAWRPRSNMAEPMASALRRAAEAAGHIEFEAPTPSEPQSPAAERGAAAAPARAKEIALPRSKPGEVEPALVASLDRSRKDSVEQGLDEGWGSDQAAQAALEASFPKFGQNLEAQANAGGSRKTLVVTVLLLGVAAAAYFGWTRMHPAQPQPAAPAAAPAPAGTAVLPPVAASVPSAVESRLPADTVVVPSQDLNEPASNASSFKPSAAVLPDASAMKTPSPAKTASGPGDSSAVKASAPPKAEEPEPLVVKNGPSTLPKVEPAATDAESAPAPTLATGSNSEALSGLVDTNAAPAVKGPQEAVRISKGISQGLLVKRVQPSYPSIARQMRLEGPVELQATISKTGRVSGVKQLSGDAVLGQAAMEAVKQWKYKPYYLNGEPIEIQTQITVNFKLP